jgi:hypothetical protein
MNVTREIEELQKYKDSLNEVYDNLNDFAITLITNAFINGYRTGYDISIGDYKEKIDSQEIICAYESENKIG